MTTPKTASRSPSRSSKGPIRPRIHRQDTGVSNTSERSLARSTGSRPGSLSRRLSSSSDGMSSSTSNDWTAMTFSASQVADLQYKSSPISSRPLGPVEYGLQRDRSGCKLHRKVRFERFGKIISISDMQGMPLYKLRRDVCASTSAKPTKRAEDRFCFGGFMRQAGTMVEVGHNIYIAYGGESRSKRLYTEGEVEASRQDYQALLAKIQQQQAALDSDKSYVLLGTVTEGFSKRGDLGIALRLPSGEEVQLFRVLSSLRAEFGDRLYEKAGKYRLLSPLPVG